MESIKIGTNVLIAWDACIMDSDMHTVFNLNCNKAMPKCKSVEIGDDVWIGTKSIILKGSRIAKGSIVGAGAVVTRQFEAENAIIAGNPATIVKTGYTRRDN